MLQKSLCQQIFLNEIDEEEAKIDKVNCSKEKYFLNLISYKNEGGATESIYYHYYYPITSLKFQ